MAILEMLLERQKELEAQKAVIEKDLSDVAKAIAAINGPASAAVKLEGNQPSHPMPVDKAIVIAVREGSRTPVQILDYLRKRLGVHTTINSVRTRVSKLKNDGRIDHDETGWVPSVSQSTQLMLESA
ncbi:hypothetical protein [Sphingosinicella rhizophila]|uniref:Uncharacterized protein n=1 Tax=Sphingosinicella rhizophila TaxID=3050082 RepID=A0ABU3Q9E3_9SPHN|nr:hypothetical protein [Sphingosinicella sp. GR2756]MDT9600029.1 hypothetical protein [Sphingosinicella sp. GR2756]